jgi:hypothetical protein
MDRKEVQEILIDVLRRIQDAGGYALLNLVAKCGQLMT